MPDIDELKLPAAYVLEDLGDVDCLRTAAGHRATEGAEEGTLLVASNVLNGRGYQDKAWQGFNDNFHASLILQPECEPDRFHEMLIVGMTSLGSAIATHVAPMTSLTYRWPNDLYIAGQKIGSVWLDQGNSPEGPWLTVTASVNLLHAPGDDSGDFSLPTMSVREAEGNSDITTPVLLETWSRQFIAEINNWDERGFAHVLAYWKVRAEQKELAEITLKDGSAISGKQIATNDDASITIQQTAHHTNRITLPQYMHWE